MKEEGGDRWEKGGDMREVRCLMREEERGRRAKGVGMRE